MRSRAVAGVAELREHLRALDAIAEFDLERALLQMSVERIHAAAKIENDVVAIDGVDGDG